MLHRSIEQELDRLLISTDRITGGTINEVHRLRFEDHDDLILRRAPARNEIGSFPSWMTPHGLRREQSALKLLASLGSILPKTVIFHQSDDASSGDWVVQTIVSGRPAAEVIPELSIVDACDISRQFGKLTRAIHDVRGSFFGPTSHGSAFATWSDLLIHDCAGFQRDSEFVTGLEEEVDALLEIIQCELDAIAPVLIHSDLNLEHVFLEQRGDDWDVSGLIDLEFARFADPLSEGVLHAMLTAPPTRQTSAFLEGYGDVEIDPVRLEISARLGRCWDLTDRERLIRARSE